MNNDEKNCQYCGETIKAIAIKCKHCKSNIQNITSSIEPNDAKKQAVNNDNSRLSAKSIILTLLFPILGLSLHFYNNSRKGLDFFGNIKIDCDSKSVVSTVKKIIFKEIKQISKLDGISTEEKQNDYRSCFALLTISKLNIKDVQLQYEVRRADNKKTFTVGVFPLFDYDFDIENLQDEVSDLLINEDGLINQTNQRKSSNQEVQINKNVNNTTDSGFSKNSKNESKNNRFENTYLQIDKEFFTKIKDSNRAMVVQIALMTQYDNRVFDNVKKHEFVIRSEISNVMRQTTEADISHPDFRANLASKIKDVINNILKEYEDFGGIEDVFFTSFLMQDESQ